VESLRRENQSCQVALRIVCVAKDSGLLRSTMSSIGPKRKGDGTNQDARCRPNPRSGCIAPFQALEAAAHWVPDELGSSVRESLALELVDIPNARGAPLR
jgi:hypothetical protein